MRLMANDEKAGDVSGMSGDERDDVDRSIWRAIEEELAARVGRKLVLAAFVLGQETIRDAAMAPISVGIGSALNIFRMWKTDNPTVWSSAVRLAMGGGWDRFRGPGGR